MVKPKLEFAEVIWSPQEKHVLKLERIQRITTKNVAELKDLTYEEGLKELHSTMLEDRIKRIDLITIYKLMNDLDETEKEDLILRRGEAGYLRGRKNCKEEST